MLDYTTPTARIPVQVQELSERMMHTVQNISMIYSEEYTKESSQEYPEEKDFPPIPFTSSSSTSYSLTQVTINEYLPGQGIAQHIGNIHKQSYIRYKEIGVFIMIQLRCVYMKLDFC